MSNYSFVVLVLDLVFSSCSYFNSALVVISHIVLVGHQSTSDENSSHSKKKKKKKKVLSFSLTEQITGKNRLALLQ